MLFQCEMSSPSLTSPYPFVSCRNSTMPVIRARDGKGTELGNCRFSAVKEQLLFSAPIPPLPPCFLSVPSLGAWLSASSAHFVSSSSPWSYSALKCRLTPWYSGEMSVWIFLNFLFPIKISLSWVLLIQDYSFCYVIAWWSCHLVYGNRLKTIC